MRQAPRVALTSRERQLLEGWRDRPSGPVPRLRRRASIVLMASDGHTNVTIAHALGLTPATVSLWRRRFAMHGVTGIERPAPYAGSVPRVPSPSELRILAAIRARTNLRQSHWTIRGVARELGLQPMQVFRVCQRHHLLESTHRDLASDAPLSVRVAGLYLRPPVVAAVFDLGSSTSESAASKGGRVPTGPGEPAVAGGDPLFRLPVGQHMAEFMDLVRRSVDLLAPARGTPSAVSDLLIFLREVESTNPPTEGSLCAVVGCPDPPGVGRVVRWVESHPHVTLHHHATTVEWLSAMDHFCDNQVPSPALRSTVRSLEYAATAMTRWAARNPRRPIGWAWSARASRNGPGIGNGPEPGPIRLV